MADNKDKRSLWKRVSEGIQTFVPKDPGSYSARKLSIEAQRENAINWLSKQPFVERSKEEFGSELPSKLITDQAFAKQFHERFGEQVANKVLPFEVRRSTEYQAATNEHHDFLNAALKHDEIALQMIGKGSVFDGGTALQVSDRRVLRHHLVQTASHQVGLAA